MGNCSPCHKGKYNSHNDIHTKPHIMRPQKSACWNEQELKSYLDQVFDKYDLNHDHHLDHSELKLMIKEIAMNKNKHITEE